MFKYHKLRAKSAYRFPTKLGYSELCLIYLVFNKKHIFMDNNLLVYMICRIYPPTPLCLSVKLPWTFKPWRIYMNTFLNVVSVEKSDGNPILRFM